MVALGEVGDEGHGHAHVDAGPYGDGEHSQEEGPPGAGAGLVEVPLATALFVCRGRRERKGAKMSERGTERGLADGRP